MFQRTIMAPGGSFFLFGPRETGKSTWLKEKFPTRRALDRTLTVELAEKTPAYGAAFEHFLIAELRRLSDYAQNDWRFSYLRTKDGAEIDLIIDRPGRPTALVEIKSTRAVTQRDTAAVQRFLKDFRSAEAYCLSRDPHPKMIGDVLCLPWRMGVEELFRKRSIRRGKGR